MNELNEQGNTIVLITHDDGIADNAKRVVRIMDGKIESDTTKYGMDEADLYERDLDDMDVDFTEVSGLMNIEE